MQILLYALVAFLVGGIPFGYLVGRLVLRDDIRNHGSGNIGATNVGRVLGWKWGSLVLVLDALKGLLPTLVVRIHAGQTLGPMAVPSGQMPVSNGHVMNAVIAAGVCAIIGHMFPVYLRLRGGKGVATALGVVLVVAPWASLIAFGAFAVCVAITRIVGLSSIVAALSFAGTQIWILREQMFDSQKRALAAFSIGVPALIIWRHRSNIMRLLAGTEKKFSAGSSPSEASSVKPSVGETDEPSATS